jgi:hypothetical protein
MTDHNGDVSMKLFVWVIGGMFSLFFAGFISVAALGSWALELHERHPHPGAATVRQWKSVDTGISDIRQDIRDLRTELRSTNG